jgi:hypothetical protein
MSMGERRLERSVLTCGLGIRHFRNKLSVKVPSPLIEGRG